MTTQFDVSWFESHREKPQLQKAVIASEISPLVKTPGWLQLTDMRMYFQPLNNVSLVPVQKYELDKLVRIFQRRHALEDVGLELFFSDDPSASDVELERLKSVFLSFDCSEKRNRVIKAFTALKPEILGGNAEELDAKQNLWMQGELSNYQYLFFLNQFAGRTLKDITQYPVFPWILKDYSSDTLNLNAPDSYRDLSKPIGALDPHRLAVFQKRMVDLGFPPEEAFLYGTHYSTPAYVLFFLVRAQPDLMLCLQNGRFDEPDRLFNSISEASDSVLKNPADLKELLPEFFDTSGKPGEFLKNSYSLELGMKQDGTAVDDVQLPKWASSPEDFIRKNREALESDYVSDHLHSWIDLIFGCKSRGEAALQADNLFHPLTYEGAVKLEEVEDLAQREALEAQINEFGQTPPQIFKEPHPKRFSMANFVQAKENIIFNSVEPSASSGIRQNKNFDKIEFVPIQKNILDLHRGDVLGVSVKNELSCSVGKDGALKVYDMSKKRLLRSALVSPMSLSCCQFSPSDPSKILSGGWDNQLHIFSIGSGTVVNSVRVHDDAVSALDIGVESVLTGSWDASAKLWDISTMTCTFECLEHRSELLSLALFNDTALSGGEDGIVYMYDFRGNNLARELCSLEDPVKSVKFSTDGKNAAFLTSNGRIVLQDIGSSGNILDIDLADDLCSLLFVHDSLLIGHRSGEFTVIDTVTGNIERNLPISQTSDAELLCFDFSIDSRHLAIGSSINLCLLSV